MRVNKETGNLFDSLLIGSEALASMDYFKSRKKLLPFSMAVVNVELMHECLRKHSHIRTAKNEIRL